MRHLGSRSERSAHLNAPPPPSPTARELALNAEVQTWKQAAATLYSAKVKLTGLVTLADQWAGVAVGLRSWNQPDQAALVEGLVKQLRDEICKIQTLSETGAEGEKDGTQQK